MSDFIFSTKNIEHNKITTEIQSIYSKDYPTVKEFHGDWGSLGISRNLYHGFNPYENDQHIAVIVGGPILMFHENRFLNDKDSFEGTKAIYDHWQSGKMKWDEDLSGPFVVLIINKKTGKINFITDIMSFIPVYSYNNSKNIVVSTHVDVLAKITEQSNNLDEVSVVDFILHGVVTYPYTTYMDVFQVEPASLHSILSKSIELQSTSYWKPKEVDKYNTINEAATYLRDSLIDYVGKITKETRNIAQFISGGEDSRTLSALLEDYPRDAFIFLDHMNREGEIAEKVANIHGANFKLFTRSKQHYLDILENCSDLVGSGSQYHHAHTYGFHKSCNLSSYSAIFGGLFSDALLKGARIKKIHRSVRFPFLPDIKNVDYSAGKPLKNTFFTPHVLLKLTKRRQAHLKYVKRFRNESAEEWFELWPSSMNRNIPNMHANRRLFRSYEPFMSNKVVKISASVPEKWKLNRRLFYKAVKPLLKSTKWLIHTDGRFPYFSWYTNIFIQFTTWTYRQIAKKIGFIKGNQGPWGEWNKVVNSDEWDQVFTNYSKVGYKNLDVFNKKLLQDPLINNKLSTHQYINLTQVFYQINNKKSSTIDYDPY